jgi:hypothetical protein
VVNSDPTRESAKSLAKAEKLDWPIVWDGSPNGTIAQKWNVRSWPLIQIIDHRGIILHQFNGAPDPELLKAIVLKSVSDAAK